MSRRTTETVQWLAFAAGADDAHGNADESWADPVDVGVWRFSPGRTQEPFTPGHDRDVSEPVIYLPGPAMSARDKVVARGIEYEVVGSASQWISDTVSGYEIHLRRVDG